MKMIRIVGEVTVRFKQLLTVPDDEADEILADREIQIINLDLNEASKEVIELHDITARVVREWKA